jgi:hypothetical protein
MSLERECSASDHHGYAHHLRVGSASTTQTSHRCGRCARRRTKTSIVCTPACNLAHTHTDVVTSPPRSMPARCRRERGTA